MARFSGGQGGYVCVYILKIKCLSETFLILRRIQRDIATNVNSSSFKVPVIPFRVREFYRRASKNTQIHNFVKIRPVGARLFRAGVIDMKRVAAPIVA